MEIVLNGEKKTVSADLSVAGLLAGLGLDDRRVVVERNRDILSREAYEEIRLEEGDRLEVLSLVSGG